MRQYQSFMMRVRTADESGPKPYGSLSGLGESVSVSVQGEATDDSGVAAYISPDGSELLTKRSFVEKFGFVPTEERLNEVSSYGNKKPTNGAEALPIIQPGLLKDALYRGETPSREYEALEQSGVNVSLPFEPLFPKYLPGAPPPSPIDAGSPCCIPACARPSIDTSRDVSAPAPAELQPPTRTYGGQSVISVVDQEASSSTFSSPPAESVVVTTGDSAPPPPSDPAQDGPVPGGFLDAVTPKTPGDWKRMAIGFGIGIVAAKILGGK